jgi:hypothetical protein
MGDAVHHHVHEESRGSNGGGWVHVNPQFVDREPGHDVKRALLTPGTAPFHRLPLFWRKDLGIEWF